VPSSSRASRSDSRGLSFGTVAETYALGRPEWPPEVLDVVPVSPGSDVLDLAAGTGRLTRLLATRHRVVAVEPDDAMRALIAGGEALEGSAEAVPASDASFDAVFVGEAFHWFDPRRALAEIARVLRPRGVLAILFQTDSNLEPPIPDEARAFLRTAGERFGPTGGPKVASGEWRSAFPGPFEELRQVDVEHASVYHRERVVALCASMSNVARQPAPVRHAFAEELSALVPEGPRTLVQQVAVYWTRLRKA
jgi:SAM-dependent methyltransferase